MNPEQLNDWLDRHHVHVLRMGGVLPDGVQIGRFVHRDKFVRSLPLGCPVDESVLASDLSGALHNQRAFDGGETPSGGLYQKPDLATLITDGTDPDLGHCVAEFTDSAGGEVAICPRTLLRRALDRLQALGYTIEVAFQLQFNLFEERFIEARQKGYRNLRPAAISDTRMMYLNRNAYPVQKFMNEAVSRLEWRGIEWDAWNTDAGPGKVTLDLAPCDPLVAADRTIRTRHALFEVAVDSDRSISFMAQPVAGNECRMRIGHALQQPVAIDAQVGVPDPDAQQDWYAGLAATHAAATSLFYPSINAYRALEENALMVGGDQNPQLSSVTGSADTNPYLALTALIAGGIAGLRHRLGRENPDACRSVGGAVRPTSLPDAIDALAQDELLSETLGRDFTRYWIRSRKWEENLFSKQSHANPNQSSTSEVSEVTEWELLRYFELI